MQILVPVLILATVALSTSNLLPVDSEQLNPGLDYNYQQNDNTFNDKQQRRKLNAILFNFDVEPEIDKTPNYINNNDNLNQDFNRIRKNDINNVKGFRKEQWHNYPRQLDRLNRYFYQHQNTDKRNLDPDDPGKVFEDNTEKTYEEIDDRYKNDVKRTYEEMKDDLTNEYVPNNEEIENDEAEMAAAVINPLLILRIHLDCYNKPNQVIRLDNENLDSKDGDGLIKEINPSNQIKVKREDKTKSDDIDSTHETENPTVNKRIFALFSRLQSLNPKGHQLHHRRHMYAMYNPDNEGGGVLTAETRATFMRPPGSPLRWG